MIAAFGPAGCDVASNGQYARREDVAEFKRLTREQQEAGAAAAQSPYLYELAKWVDSVRPVVVGAVAATAVKKPVPQVIHCGYCGGRLDSRVCVECGERLLT